MSKIVPYSLHSTSVLSIHVDVVLTLSIEGTRTQHMTVTNHDHYPIKTVCISDTGASSEWMRYRLEPLSCGPGKMCIHGCMMTAWHKNTFRNTGPLWGEFTGHKKVQSFDSFLLLDRSSWTKSLVTVASRRLNAHETSLQCNMYPRMMWHKPALASWHQPQWVSNPRAI